MQLGLSESLPALVARRFTAARDAGHLVFSKTHLSIINAAGISYQLRYCPALAKKPSNLKPEPGPKPKPDPFENPSPDLLIAQFPPEKPVYNLILNKFPVIPNHFLLVTKDWQAQTDLLDKADLEATYECLKAWNAEDDSKSLFAFFNSGDDSGASQPHRHLQFLPVEAMRQPGSEAWHPLIDLLQPTSPSPSTKFQHLSGLPFAHFALPLPPNPSADTLHSIYITLYKAAAAATRGHSPGQDTETLSSQGPSSISYNLAMTRSTMLICPRKQETALMPIDPAAARDIADPGVLSLNGTILAATLMVKAEGEWDSLRENPEHLTQVLATVGYPRTDSRGPSL
ncbi:ATP adenylyltransferase C-terminal [Penicillium brevicompactum]|uniref:ATP adenylyltransferase C-terminal n=1 Tax=Penicillium brevicompactum TaxID=5074 RepID=UPI0025416D40|nr:ATP adenylyltransferase C-terminal [Penicillium brevicompactum]KAJ5348034.1 ATP adenylyltransferase C-terminal [Penicillium brevicompactum]